MSGRTMSEAYGPAVKAALAGDKALSSRIFAELVTIRLVDDGMTYGDAVELERQNLAYWAGYFDHATRLAVESAYECEHPFLGRAADGELTSSEALAIGYAIAGKTPMEKVKELRLKWAAIKDLDAREAEVRSFLRDQGFYDKVRE